MSGTFDVVYDLANLRCHDDKVVTGGLALVVDGSFFPEPQWDDFVVRVLDMWVNSARIMLDQGGRENFPFMDGSFGFWAEYSRGFVDIACYIDHKLQQKGPAMRVPAREFIVPLRRAAKQVENWAQRARCESDDLRFLGEHIDGLDEVTARVLGSEPASR